MKRGHERPIQPLSTTHVTTLSQSEEWKEASSGKSLRVERGQEWKEDKSGERPREANLAHTI